MATGCSFRVSTTDPDGNREDKPLDELLDESERLDSLTELEDLEGNLTADFNGNDFQTGDGESFSLKANFKDSPTKPPQTLDPESLQPAESVYTEVSREVEQVEVTSDDGSATVTIDRMTSVSFETEQGKKMVLNFNNPTP